MKKRVLVCLCIFVIALSLLYPALASADNYDVTSIANITKVNGDFYFHVLLDSSDILYSNANLALAIYNAKGKLLDVKMEEVNQDDTEKIFVIDENTDIASYKVMLFGADGKFTPICKPCEESIAYSEIEELTEVKILVKDIKGIDGTRLEYYPFANSSETKMIIFSDSVFLNLIMVLTGKTIMTLQTLKHWMKI